MRWSRLLVVALAGVLAAGRASAQSTYTWNLDAAGTWDTATANWLLSGSPSAWANGTNTAVFGSAITASRTLATATTLQAGSLQFTNTGPFLYTIGTGSTNVALNNGGSNASVTVSRGVVGAVTYAPSGGHLLQSANYSFANSLNITNNAAFGTAGFSVSAALTGAGAGGITFGGQGGTGLTGALTGFTGGIVKNGTGTLSVTSGSNTYGGTITINGGVFASGSGDASLGNAANGVIINAGGTFRPNGLTTARAITINGTGASPSGIDLPSGVTTTLSGSGAAAGLVGSGTARVSITGGTTSGTLSVEGAQTGFTGSLVVGTPGLQLVGAVASQRVYSTSNAATLRLQGAGALANATAVTLNNAAALTVVQSTPAVTNRLTAPITSHSGRFLYTQSANAGNAINETFGSLTVTGVHTFTGSGTAGPAAGTTLNFGNLVRTDNSMLLFRAPQSGTQGTFGGAAATTSVRVFFANLTPDTTSSGTTRSVVGWAGNPTSTSETDTQNLMTYDANGFRPLNTTTEAATLTAANTLAAAVSGANIRTTGSGLTQTVLSGGQTINSFTSTVTQTVTAASAADVLTITSGGLATFNTVTFSNVTLAFPNGAYFHSGFPFAVSGTSRVTGSGGVAVGSFGASSSYQLRLTNTLANTFTGGLYVQGNAGVTFTDNAQLGQTAGGLNAGDVVFGGGQLIYNPAAAATVNLTDGGTNRPIRVNESNGTIGAGLAAAVLQIPGVISGAGQVQFGGGGTSSATGVVSLTGGANTYTGGTVVSTGILQFTAGNQLGTGPVFLNGGTLRAGAAGSPASPTLAVAPTVVAASTIDTPDAASTLTLPGLGGSSGTLGTGLSGLTKTGPGTLTVTGDSTFAGSLTLASTTAGGTGGTFTLNGAGAAPDLGAVQLQLSTVFNVDDSTGPLQRTGRSTNLSLRNTTTTATTGGSTVNLTFKSGGGSTFTFGTLDAQGGAAATPNTSTINLLDGGSGNNVVNFLSLTAVAANNTLNLSGTTNFGQETGPSTGTRLFFQTAPTLTNGAISNVVFTGAGGTGPASYDAQLGVVKLSTVTGTTIDNASPTSTPVTAVFTTGGATTANLGATIKSLTVAGHVVTLVPGVNAPSGTNLNAPSDTLVLTAGGLTVSTASSTVTAGAASKLQFGANAGINVNTFDLAIGANVTVVGTLGLTKSGTGNLTISGPNQLGGVYTIGAAGTVTLTQAASIGGLAGTAGTVAPGALLTFTGAATSSFSGVLSGTAGLTLANTFTGQQTLAGTNTMTGPGYPVAVNGGTLVLGSTSALGAANTATVTVASGGTLGFSGGVTPNTQTVGVSGPGATGRAGAIDNISGTNTYAGPITLNAAATIGATAGSLNLSGGITAGGNALTLAPATGSTLTLSTVALNLGTGALTVAGTGTGAVVLPNLANTLGNTTVTGGLVRASADNNLGATTNTLTLNGGGFQYGAVGFAFDPARTVTLGAAGGFLDTNALSPTLGTVIGGSGSLTKSGTGTLTVTAAQTYAGNTTVTGGTLAMGVAGALPATGVLTLGNVAASDTNGLLTLGGFNQTVAGLTVVGPSASTTRLSGAGTLTINGPINFVNNTANPNNAFPVTLGTVGSTVIDLAGGVRAVNVTANVNTNDLVLNALVQNGGLTYAGTTNVGSAAAIQLNGANTFNGGLTVTSGVLNVSSTGTLGAATNALTITATGAAGVGTNSTVNTASAQTVGSLSGGTLSGTAVATLALGGNVTINQSTNTTFGGVISGATFGLTKSGTGILTLAGANTYTGATTVSGGTLRVNGSLAATAVTVAAGASLGGTGTIGGTVAFSGGSTLAPGASIGTLTVAANTTITGAANPTPTVWQVELNGISSGGGNALATPDTANVDRLVATGAANINFLTDGTNRVRIDLSQLGGTFDGSGNRVYFAVATATAGANLQSNGGTFDPTGFDFGTFAVAVPGTMQIELNGANLVVSFIPVPEPATVLAVAAVGLAGLRAARSRRVVG